MKICVLVKEVPDAAVEKRIDSETKRLDRSGEKNLNPFDTHAIEAAMQVKEGGKADVDEVVAVTMGPESAVRALHKAVSLGADRSVHLTDEALAGSDVCATGYALGQVLKQESPDLVLLGQQSDDGECYTIGAVGAHRHSDDFLDLDLAPLLDLHRGLDRVRVEGVEVGLAGAVEALGAWVDALLDGGVRHLFHEDADLQGKTPSVRCGAAF